MKFLLFLFLLSPVFLLAQPDQEIPKSHKKIYSSRFPGEKSLRALEFVTPNVWLRSRNGNKGGALKFWSPSKASKGLNPDEYALISEYQVADFILEADVLQEGRNFYQRDICIIWGYKDSSNYSFAQIADNQKQGGFQIFEVKNGNTMAIGGRKIEAVNWGFEEWHQVKVIREVAETSIKIYLDTTLVLASQNIMSDAGLVGFGTVCDAGKIDNIKLYAPAFTSNQEVKLHKKPKEKKEKIPSQGKEMRKKQKEIVLQQKKQLKEAKEKRALERQIKKEEKKKKKEDKKIEKEA